MIHRATDSVTLGDILSAIQLWFSHPEFDAQTPVVWHLGDARLDLSIQELTQLYELVRSAVASKRAGGRTAWVHSSAMVGAMINIVRDEYDWGSEWQTFDTLDDAERWCLRG